MGQCVASIRSGQPCGNPTEPGYKFCSEHKTRRKALEERETKSLGQVIEATEVFGGEVDKHADKVPAKIPTEQKNVFEKTMEALDRSIDWEQQTWEQVQKLTPDEWHTEDKAGVPQQHPFIGMNERAQDRVIRATTAVAKLDIDAQAINVNKMVQEVVKGVVTRTLTKMGFDPQQIDQARVILAEEFERVAQQSA